MNKFAEAGYPHLLGATIERQPQEVLINEAIAHFVEPRIGLTKEYIFNYLKSFDYGKLGNTSSIATAVNSKLIKAMPFLVPNGELLKAYKNESVGWLNQISSVSYQTRTLTNLRNVLLPKLISGQLRIPDAEKLIAENKSTVEYPEKEATQ